MNESISGDDRRLGEQLYIFRVGSTKKWSEAGEDWDIHDSVSMKIHHKRYRLLSQKNRKKISKIKGRAL